VHLKLFVVVVGFGALLLGSVPLAPAADRSATTRPTVARPTTTPASHEPLEVNLSGFGIRFRGPDGWLRSKESALGQLALFIRLTDGKPGGLVEVETVPANGHTAKTLADQIAAGQGGKVVGETAGPGGVRAVEIQGPGTQEYAAVMRVAVFPVRDQLIVLSAGAPDAATATTLQRGVLATVAVSDPKPASDDLTLRRQPVSLFGTGVLISLPEAYRPERPKDPMGEMFFGARDWPTGREDSFVLVRRAANPNRAELADVVVASGKALGEKLGLPEPLTLTRVNDNPVAYLSDPFSARKDETQRVLNVDLGGDFAVLVFQARGPDPKVRDRYMEMAERVARATRVSREYEDGRRIGEALQDKK
jgi:hypothetical protein